MHRLRSVVRFSAAIMIIVGMAACAHSSQSRMTNGVSEALSDVQMAAEANPPAREAAASSRDTAQPVSSSTTVFDRQGRPLVAPPGEREVLPAKDGPVDPQGRFTRVRIVHRDGLKYPLIRQTEQMQRGPHGEVTRMMLLEAVADHLQVTVHDPLTRSLLVNALPAGCAIRYAIPGAPVVLVSIPADTHEDYPTALAALAAMPGVAQAESDWLVQGMVTPNDPSFAQQWALDNQGQGGGTVDADIDAPEGWAHHTGSRAVKVGVVDTGIDLQHPDLIDNLWTNPGEIPGNGLDDDANGYVDDVRGWNFVSNNANPDDDHFHGTHVAGTIGASTGNAVGVAGVAWQVTLVPLKFISADNWGYNSDAIAAIYYANMIGCDLTNHSWGGGTFNQGLKDAIDAAGAQGHLVVVAAGNASSDLAIVPHYPAAYACSNLIAVAATDRNDALASFSNFNATAVHIAAPGVSILSTFPTEQTAAMASSGLSSVYSSISGTSMATPHVAGALALLKSAEPGLSASAMRTRLLQRCDAIPGLVGKVADARRLNVKYLLDPSWTPLPAQLQFSAGTISDTEGNGDGTVNPGEIVRVMPTFINRGGLTATQVSVSATCNGGVDVLSGQNQIMADVASLGSAGLPAPIRLTIPSTIPDATAITVTYLVTWNGGSSSATQQFIVANPLVKAMATTTFAMGSMTVDEQRNRVYLLDKSSPAVLAVNLDTGRLVHRCKVPATFANNAFAGDRGVVSPDGSTLFLCDTAGKAIQRFALPDLTPVGAWSYSFAPVGIAQGANGRIYVSSLDYWGDIRQIDPATGMVLGQFQKSGGYNPFYQSALVRMDPDRQRLFVTESGLRTEGGPSYVYEYEVAGAGLPIPVKAHPYNQQFCSDFLIDTLHRRIYTMNGGIYAVQVTDMASGAYGQTWPLGAPYARAVAQPTGSPYLYGASGGSYDSSVVRFQRANGQAMASIRVSDSLTYSVDGADLSATPNGRLLAVTKQWRGDGGGYFGYNWRLVLIGGTSLNLLNLPRAVGTVSPLNGPIGMTVTVNGGASFDPDVGGGIASHHWDFGDGATASGPSASHTYVTRGTYTVSLRVTDIEGASDRQSFTVVVNSAPAPQAQSVSTLEDTAKTIVLSAIDPEGDPITYSISTSPAKGSLSGTAPNLTYTPWFNQNGSDSFVFRASDGLSSATATVSISITPVNDPPVVGNRSVLTKIDLAVPVSIVATDPDSAVLTYQILQAPTSGLLSGAAPNLTFTPATGFAGLDSFTFTAGDGMVTTAPATVTIRVNRPPVAQSATVAVTSDIPAPIALVASDPDGQALTYRVTGNPTRGTLSGSAPNLTYTPRPGEIGSDSVVFVANDGFHDSAPATVSLTITATNPWPEADLAMASPVGSVAFIPTVSGFTVRGSGDLGPSDGGRFTWTTLPADGTLVGRITGITVGRGGLVLRSAVAADAACAALLLDASGQLQLVIRANEGLIPTTTALGAQTAPCWLRLQRTGNDVTAARSSDGKIWSFLASSPVTLPTSALAGIWAGSSGPTLAQLSVDQVRTHHSLDRTWQTLSLIHI
jgi:subtilisin family serine protease